MHQQDRHNVPPPRRAPEPPRHSPPQRHQEQPRYQECLPPPEPPRPKTIILPPRDGRAMTVLRVTTYVLTSLASLLFIALVIYGAVQLDRARTALEDLYGGVDTPSLELPPAG